MTNASVKRAAVKRRNQKRMAKKHHAWCVDAYRHGRGLNWYGAPRFEWRYRRTTVRARRL